MGRLQERIPETRTPLRSGPVTGKRRRNLPTADTSWFEPVLEDIREAPKLAPASEPAPETPEVFALHPLASHPVTVIVREAGPASFYFVAEADSSTDADAQE